MPGYQNENRSDYSKFNFMTNDELEEILRMDAMKFDDEDSDIDMLMYVMGVLAERRRSSADPGKTPEEAYQSFVDNYYTDDTEVTEEDIHNKKLTEPKRSRAGWRRFITVAAACFAILLFGVVTTAALGGESLNAFFDWTKEIFSFSSGDQNSETGPSPEYVVDDTWENVLRKKNIPENLMLLEPLEGYEQIDLHVYETPEMSSITGLFTNGDKRMRMAVKLYLGCEPQKIEKTDELLEIYESNGIFYYIFSNKDQIQAVWQYENYECIIFGNFSVEEIKSMIDAI